MIYLHKMEMTAEYEVEFESLKSLLLDMAQERTLDTLLSLVVRRLAERPHVALARIWLIKPGDICASCPMRKECPDQTACLHLVASAGQSTSDPSQDWSYVQGRFRRFPLGVRKVGQIAKSGESIVVREIDEDHHWIARPEWAQLEEIRGFEGQPITHKGEVLGVLGVFSRVQIPPEEPTWLRMIADHAGAAIANARAFEEIERLSAQLAAENTYLREDLSESESFGDIVGQSPAIAQVAKLIEVVAPTEATVLITGESGTGKELVSRVIHERSRRKGRPLVRVNCASVPRELYESEFFGHVKGSFTGALKDRAGRFEAADGGTLFLDEVGEIPLELQSKLLRVLQEGEYERVGDDRTRKINVRIIAATNRNLLQEVEQGRFRQDLYFRLNVFPIEVPPLRDRREDIPLIAAKCLQQVRKKLGCEGPGLTESDGLRLQDYDWPGNVRELQNIIERAVIAARCGKVRFDLPILPSTIANSSSTSSPSVPRRTDDDVLAESDLRQIERANIIAALEQSDWRVYGPGAAAERLRLKPTTLASRMKKMGIKKSSRPQI